MPLIQQINPAFPEIDWVLTTSQNWSPPFKCKVLAFVIGAGGLSGKIVNQTSNVSYGSSGSGAGGCAASILTLDPTVSYTATIGSGASHTLSGTQPGADGGNTTFSGSDIATMTGNGGSAGVQSFATSGGTVSLSGGAGGTATGGNLFNATGGAGGDAGNTGASPGSSSGSRFAGGGGAVGILGVGYRGGHAISTTGTPTVVNCAAGGAGVGGRGGDLEVQTATASADYASGAGSAYGPGEDKVSALGGTVTTLGGLGRAGDEPLLGPEGIGSILAFAGSARSGNTGSTARPAAGVGGEGQLGASVFNAGIFAGGGGISSNRSVAGDTFFGGGTGGAATTTSSGIGCKAGDGVVIIKLMEIIA